jgi:hypothetical protein
MARRGPNQYAVVGLGHIARVAVLPGFAHARRNSRLLAVSDDEAKRQAIARRYRFESSATQCTRCQQPRCRLSISAAYLLLAVALIPLACR